VLNGNHETMNIHGNYRWVGLVPAADELHCRGSNWCYHMHTCDASLRDELSRVSSATAADLGCSACARRAPCLPPPPLPRYATAGADEEMSTWLRWQRLGDKLREQCGCSRLAADIPPEVRGVAPEGVYGGRQFNPMRHGALRPGEPMPSGLQLQSVCVCVWGGGISAWHRKTLQVCILIHTLWLAVRCPYNDLGIHQDDHLLSRPCCSPADPVPLFAAWCHVQGALSRSASSPPTPSCSRWAAPCLCMAACSPPTWSMGWSASTRRRASGCWGLPVNARQSS
jgi:hypothetical protein